MIRKALQIVEMKEAADDVGSGTAVFATLNVIDHDGDLTLPGAIGAQQVKMLASHDWRTAPIGYGNTREEGNKCLCDFEMNLKQAAALEWYQAIKFDFDRGKLMEWSYGFSLKEWELRKEEGREWPIRVFKSVEVHEVSPVVLGAGIDTGTTSVKQRKEAEYEKLAGFMALQTARGLLWRTSSL